ncbi:MAG: glycosyltransferase [SAR202 cluster bacterium]|nr:glycosyltransferase [SAR202 cluster bacterium]
MNGRTAPQVAFGMTIYNKAQFLPEAIESLLNQTYSDFTIVAVDNASTDASKSIMNVYKNSRMAPQSQPGFRGT